MEGATAPSILVVWAAFVMWRLRDASGSRPVSSCRRRPATRREGGIDGQRTGTGQYESERGREQDQRILVARGVEEARRQVHEQDGTEHLQRKSHGRQPGQQSDDEGDTTEEFEQRNERTDEARRGDAHLGERAGDTGEAVGEQLLAAVDGEDDAGNDADDRDAELLLRRAGGGQGADGHRSLLSRKREMERKRRGTFLV